MSSLSVNISKFLSCEQFADIIDLTPPTNWDLKRDLSTLLHSQQFQPHYILQYIIFY